MWGVGGVFPRVSTKKRRQPKTRDFEQERVAEQEQRRPQAVQPIPQQEVYQSPRYTAETADTLPTPQLERSDPFANIGRQTTSTSARPSIAGPIPSHAPSHATSHAPSRVTSTRSRSTTVCGTEEGASPTGSHEDEQGQVGGPLMEENEQWEEELEGDLAEPPVRNKWVPIRCRWKFGADFSFRSQMGPNSIRCARRPLHPLTVSDAFSYSPT